MSRHSAYADRDHEVEIEPIDEGSSEPQPELGSVINILGRLYRSVAEALQDAGLSLAEYRILTHLDGAPSNVGLDELTSAVRDSPAAISRLVRQLSERELVRLDGDGPDDRLSASLTPNGAARARDGQARLELVLHDVEHRLSSGERGALRRLLGRIAPRAGEGGLTGVAGSL